MKTPGKKNLLKWNTILWLTAMVLPAFFSLAFASSKLLTRSQVALGNAPVLEA